MKKKNLLLNIVMVLAVLSVVSGGVFLTKYLKNGNGKTELCLVDTAKGNATIERNKIGYTLKSGTKLVEDDCINTLSGSSVTIKSDNFTAVVDEKSNVKINEIMQINAGTVYYKIKNAVQISVAGIKIKAENSVFSVTCISDIPSVNVFSGNVDVNDGEISVTEAMCLFVDSDGTFKTDKITAADMSNFELEVSAQPDMSICFGIDEIEEILKSRNKVTPNQNTVSEVEDDKVQSDTPISSQSVPDETAPEKEEMYVTLKIDCEILLDKLDKLKDGKSGFVPSNGIVFPETKIKIEEGTTVYDVLSSICNENNIQLECAWTPIYNSYYIEGINQLYELDCGAGSGWIYRVNGWKPNYGVSGYTLNNGDVVNIRYTCNYGDD